MKIIRRNIYMQIPVAIRWITACATALLASAVLAQSFPARPITVVAAYPPGSATDNVARPFAVALQAVLGSPVVVENRAGGQGIVGTDSVARSKPDGYTVLVTSSITFAGSALVKNLPYDPDKSFQPISGMGGTSYMFVVNANSPYRSIAELVAASEAPNAPIAVAYGSATAQVVLGMFSGAARANITPVAYRGGAQVITDLLGGQVPAALVGLGDGLAMIKAGRLRPLAITAKERSPLAPNVPTLMESWPSSALEIIIALVAPAGTPPEIVEKLDAATRAALGKPELKQAWANAGTDVAPLSTAELIQALKVDTPKWQKFIKAAGIEPQ